MPKNYDFSTEGKDFKKYWDKFILRTDAVWEKTKLKDMYRLMYKNFYFNPDNKKYYMLEPEDMHRWLNFPSTLLEDVHEFKGYSDTGKCVFYEKTNIKPLKPKKSSAMAYFSKEDFFELCGY